MKKLFLAQNQINDVDSKGFQGLDNLEELDINSNLLTLVSSELFYQCLPKLKKLNLVLRKNMVYRLLI